MGKELKDFVVWHPPPPPEDEPFIVDQPMSEWVPYWMQRRKQKLTGTGYVWLFFPFCFLFWKKLSFSMIEFFIWIAAWGGSAGSVASVLCKYQSPWQALIVPIYFISHLHCLMFTSAIYQARRNGPSYPRMAHVLLPQLLLFGVCTFLRCIARR